MKVPVSVVVLTRNEAEKIADCLASVVPWADEVVVLDSGSTDDTCARARACGVRVETHAFDNYSSQRNWAQEHLGLRHEWVFHLDADERVTPELAQSIAAALAAPGGVRGYLVSRRTMFMGRWIRHGGHYPVYHMRLFLRAWGRCEDRLYDQHYMVEGPLGRLQGDLVDIFASDLSSMIERHNRWTSAAALIINQRVMGNQVQPRFFGSPVERRRWLRLRVYERGPLLVRAWLLFIYRYFLRGGFLDGREGLIFHFLQGCWVPFLTDAKLIEMSRK
jgi:glycosyltransferase involved in cell wall biosynthesis